MKSLSVEAFQQACQDAIDEDVDFVLIAGDLFHTAIPSLDLVQTVVRTLRSVNEQGIRCYFIPGSHDCSPTGKTMLNVIEEANLGVNVDREDKSGLTLTEDDDGARITGVSGETGMLDQERYHDLNVDAVSDDADTVFMFHTAVDELKPADLSMDSQGYQQLPQGFDYYAGGHVHIVDRHDYTDTGYGPIVYPGPLFPTAFNELEALEHGGYYLYDDGDVERREVQLKDVATVHVTVDDQNPEDVTEAVLDALKDESVEGAIVTVRLSGTLVGGRISDIDFDAIHDYADRNDVFRLLSNTYSLQTERFKADVDEERTHEEVETDLIEEYAGQIDHVFGDETQVAKQLLGSLNAKKRDGETNQDYEERMVEEADAIITESVVDSGDEDSSKNGETRDLSLNNFT